MHLRSRVATVASVCTIVAAALTGFGISPAAASGAASRVTCAGPTKAEKHFFAHARAHGIHAQEALYNRALIGCIPLGSNGKPKQGLLQNALRQQRALVARAGSGMHSDLASTGGTWSLIGPSPIGSGSFADSGRQLSSAYDANLNGGTLFVGTADGGVWSSTSPFTTWTTHTDSLPNLAIDSVAVDPSDATGRTIYAGTGEQSAAYDALYGNGVYKSTDGGVTWAAVTGSPAGGWGRATISKIVISSTTGTVYVGIGSAFGGGAVYISTDGGATWSDATGAPGTNSVADLAIDSSNNVYAAVAAALGTQAATGVYECASPCTPLSTWTLIGGGSTGLNSFPDSATVENIKITTVPTTAGGGGTAVYAIGSNAASNGKMLGVYRLLPGSPTWIQVAPASMAASYENQAWYDMYIFGDPADASGNTVYFGLSDIYKSINAAGGAPTWTNLTNVYGGGGTGVHPDQHAATSNGSTVFFGNDGGIWDSTDGGTTFNDLNGNLSTLQFYSGDLGTNAAEGCTSNCDATARIGGMQDNGTAQTTGGATSWTAAPGFGDGGYALIDPVNNNNRYGENANGGVVNSQDGFATANDATTGGTCGASNFYAPMVLDPGTPTTLLVGMRDLCETTNANTASPTWTDIGAPGGISTTDSALSAIAVSDAGGTKIYTGDDNVSTFFTTNNGATWTSMDTGAVGGPRNATITATGVGPAPSYFFNYAISGMAADPTNSGVVYATLNGFQSGAGGHVFKWTDTGGANGTWTDISATLPNEPYDCVVVNPQDTNEIFVGGITGVFVSVDGGTTWNQMGTGLPDAAVDGLQISKDGTTLVAFTHGRSAWQISGSPTAVHVSGLRARVAHGWTTMTWRSLQKVAGYNVYRGKTRLNHKLVTSRTHVYSFRVHKVVRNPRLVAVPLA
jgi:hypothetical protein